MTERTSFEEWAKPRLFNLRRMKDFPDQYLDLSTECGWQAWQAAAELALAASPLPQEGRWMPIETAPKTLVLCYHPRTAPNRNGAGGLPAIVRAGTVHEWLNRPPTHWMPLPAAPGTQGEQKCSG